MKQRNWSVLLCTGLVVVSLVGALFVPAQTVLADDGGGIDSSEGNSASASGISSPNVSPAKIIYPDGAEIIPDQYIVVYKSDKVALKAADDIKTSVAANGGQVKYMYGAALNGFAAYLPAKALDAVLADPSIDYVEADTVVKLEDDVNTQNVSIQNVETNATWGLDRIDQRVLALDGTYQYQYRGTGVNVYVIDTGILPTHKDFGGRASVAFDAVGDGRNGIDCNGHGTHVAGTIGSTTYGVAKSVKINAVRVIGCSESGATSQIIAGINWVTAHAVRPAVANMSIGGTPSTAMDAAMNALVNKGVVVVVAAGNNNADACNYSPARVPNLITVGATDKTDTRASYSNYGACLDIFAPGTNITSTWYTSTTATNTISGTSMASPHVAGVVALYLQTHPTATVAQVTNAIKAAATVNAVKNPGTNSVNKFLTSFVNGEKFTKLVLNSPIGNTNDTTPLFKWSKVADATQYILQVYKGTSLVINKTLPVSSCATYTCSFTQPTAMTKASYTWKVRAYVSSVWKDFTTPASFTITDDNIDFSSDFTSNASGWTTVSGSWAISLGTYATQGIYGKYSTIAHVGAYTTVDYAVRMLRSGDAYSSNRIYLRGTPNPLSSDNAWNNGYIFQYSNNGKFSVWKRVNGSFTEMVDWTYSSYIAQNDWNVLEVKMQGNVLEFFINGQLLAYGTDSSLTNGQL